jgi:hypothetical protein
MKPEGPLPHLQVPATVPILSQTNIRFVISVCVRPSVRPHGTTRYHWTDVYETWYFGSFWKYIGKNQVWLRSDENNK